MKNNVEGSKIFDDLSKDLNKKFDNRIVFDNEVINWIPSGIKILDVIISNQKNGGFPGGKIIEIIGENSSGKTLLALHTAKQVQDMGGYVIWSDNEYSFSDSLAELVGVKPNKENRFLKIEPENLEQTFESFEYILLKLCAKKLDVPVLIVWDSVAATSPKAIIDGEYGEKTMGLQARELSQGIPKLNRYLRTLNVTLLALNQVRGNIGDQWNPTVSSGGRALKFYASLRIELKQAAKIKEKAEGDKDDEVIGNIIRAHVIKNRFGPPFRKVEFKMFYTRGVDEMESVIDILLSSKFLIKSGGWIKVEGNEKGYRKDEIINMLKTDKDFSEKAMSKFYEKMIKVYQTDIREIIEDEEGNVRDPETGDILYNQKEKRDIEKIADNNKVLYEDLDKKIETDKKEKDV